MAAHLGVSGSYAEAGMGRGADNTDIPARRQASQTLDHGALGWVLGGSFDLQLPPFVVGVRVDLRQHFAWEGPADRHFLPSAILRMGVAFDLLRGAARTVRGI